MNKLYYIFLVLVTFSIASADKIYIPPGACVVVPNGSTICADTLFVDTLACFIAEDTSAVCSGIVLQGSGLIYISVENISSEIPIAYKLYQNYPNPFNPLTKIRFSIPQTGKGQIAKIVIFNILGEEIATPVNQEFQPGTYEVEWNGTNYPSGVYCYQLTAGEFKEAKRMILIK